MKFESSTTPLSLCWFLFLPPPLSPPVPPPPPQFTILQSQMTLLYLVTTHCTDMQLAVDLQRMTLGLTDAQFLLFLSLLHPLPLHHPLTLHRLQHSLTSRSRGTQTERSSSTKLPDINKLRITNSRPSTHLYITAQVLNHPPHSTTLSSCPVSTSGTINSTTAQEKPFPSITNQAAQVPAALPPPLKIQNVPSSSSSRLSVPTKRPSSQHVHSGSAKKAKLSCKQCENCDFSTRVCLRCKPSRIWITSSNYTWHRCKPSQIWITFLTSQLHSLS